MNSLYTIFIIVTCFYLATCYSDNDAKRRNSNQDGRRRHHKKQALRIKNEAPFFYNKPELGPNAYDAGTPPGENKNYPYMAAIMISGRLWCAGTIVDVNWVLTAAHCLNYVLHISPMKTLQEYVKVRVGSVHAHEGGMVVSVTGAVRHPKFEEEPVPHADVALLKLAENLEFSEHVQLLKIYEGMKEPYAQSFVTISGWGATRGSVVAFRDPDSDLLSSRLKVRSKSYCADAYELVNGFMFTDDFFCASLRNGTRDACLFDAGAPAVQNNKILGVMSFGPEQCGNDEQPAVFIKAFYFRDFVRHTISSYKTPRDLIEAMVEIDPGVTPPLLRDVTEEPLDGMAQSELNLVAFNQ